MNILTQNGVSPIVYDQQEDPENDRTLDRYITSDGLTSEEREAVGDARSSLAKMSCRWMADDPSALMSSLRATDSSTASSHDVYYARDVFYYDAIDEAMRKDPDIRPAFDLVVSMALRRGYELHPADENNAKAIAIRDMVEDKVLGMQAKSFGFDYALEMLLFGQLAHGFSVCETIYANEKARYEPKACIHRHPGLFSFDAMGELAYMSARSGRLQAAPYGKFVTLQKGGMYGNPMGHSIVDQLQYVYMIKKAAYLAWVRYGENYGTPMARGSLTDKADPARIKEFMDELKAIIRNLNASRGVVLRPEQMLEFVDRGSSSSTSGGTVHEAIIDRMTRLTYRIVFGSILHIMEAEYGSRAQADTHQETSEVKVKPMAKAAATAANRDLIVPYVVINEGEAARSLAPVLSIDTDGSIDIENAIKTLEAAQKLKLPTSIAQAREWLDLSAPDSDEDTLFIDTGGSQQNDPPTFEEKKKGRTPSGSVEFAESEADRFRKAKEADELIRAIAAQASIESREMTFQSFGEYADQLKANSERAGGLVDFGARFIFPGADLRPIMTNAIKAAHLVSAAHTFQAVMAVAPAGDLEFAEVPEDTPSAFADAVEWLLDKDVMTVAQVKDLVATVAAMGFPADEEDLERTIRNEVFALAGSADPEVTRRIQSMVADAVGSGVDAADFFKGIDELRASGKLPGGSDAYWDMVYRTETGKAYQAQEDENLSDPRIASFYWGDQLFNPGDERSRQSHAAIDGLKLRKGSAAWSASRPGPPWAYSCRCIRTGVIVADAENSTMEETPGALSLISQIERF